jgi:hypothetical protein
VHQDWLRDMAAFVRQVTPRHLISASTEGFFVQDSQTMLHWFNPGALSGVRAAACERARHRGVAGHSTRARPANVPQGCVCSGCVHAVCVAPRLAAGPGAQCDGEDWFAISALPFLDYTTVHVYERHMELQARASACVCLRVRLRLRLCLWVRVRVPVWVSAFGACELLAGGVPRHMRKRVHARHTDNHSSELTHHALRSPRLAPPSPRCRQQQPRPSGNPGWPNWNFCDWPCYINWFRMYNQVRGVHARAQHSHTCSAAGSPGLGDRHSVCGVARACLQA